MTMRVIEDHETFRKNISNTFTKLVNNDKTRINIEKGIYNYALKEATNNKELRKWNNPYFVQIYTNRFKTIHHNLNSNKKLCDDINSGKLKPDVFVFMTHQEIAPEKWDELIQRKIKRDKSKYETKLAAATDSFTCRKCKSKECNYYQMQTRSADEPMTTFISCINCGNRWKC
jgi:transcription elongation factor S-II